MNGAIGNGCEIDEELEFILQQTPWGIAPEAVRRIVTNPRALNESLIDYLTHNALEELFKWSAAKISVSIFDLLESYKKIANATPSSEKHVDQVIQAQVPNITRTYEKLAANQKPLDQAP